MIALRTGLIAIASLLALAGASGDAQAAGDKIYASRCSMCHQPTGAGLPGQFPRLKGRVGAIAATKPGRAYLANVLLFGMFGGIDVDGKHIGGMMPPMGSLADQDIADTLNFVAAMEKPKKPVAPFTAAEIKAARAGGPLTASAVGKIRADLVSKGVIP
ncbi:cytochrome c [Sphingobium sp. Sx8-8]|uniref:c-type cytochrome n=1 Tax=Sphingobium sp. Sx8-8 TaxID=2933617 RepID=UPI001F58BC91|nr:cytochrome c [Sphingobium sp. Sx8-8]